MSFRIYVSSEILVSVCIGCRIFSAWKWALGWSISSVSMTWVNILITPRSYIILEVSRARLEPPCGYDKSRLLRFWPYFCCEARDMSLISVVTAIAIRAWGLPGSYRNGESISSLLSRIYCKVCSYCCTF